MLARSLIGFCLLSMLSPAVATTLAIDVQTGPTPAFVTPSNPFDTALDGAAPISDGIRVRLQERDVRIEPDGRRVDWHAIEYTLANRTGLQRHGRYSIAFEPADERLTLHAIRVRRDGRIGDRLADTRIDVLRPEPEAATSQDGRHEVGLLMPDLAVGDVVRIHWSITRAPNPMGQEITVPLDGSWPVARRLVRIRSPQDRPLTMRDGRTGDHHASPIVTTRHDDGHLYRIDLRDAPVAARNDALLPPRDRSHAALVFSDASHWRDVAAAHAPLYALPTEVPPELAREAARIRAAHADDGARVAAALQWAQTRVRYYALQIGDGAYTPASPADTLRAGHADCKGKTLLLLSLLDELGIPATAALTSLDGLASEPDQPWRWQAFDHVLVHVQLDGREHWLDPSDSHQRGALSQRRVPDQGRALRLDTGRLVAMHTPIHDVPMIDATRRIARAGDTRVFEIVTQRTRDAAEALRRDRERIDPAMLAAAWQDYYRLRRSLPITLLGEPRIDDSDAGMTSRERYAIDDAATLAPFASADEIRDRLLRWREQASGRNAAMMLASGLFLRERVIIDGLHEHREVPEQAGVRTPWFELQRIVRRDRTLDALVIDYRLTVAARRVEADRLPAFRQALVQSLELVAPLPVRESRPAPRVAQAVGAGSLLALFGLRAVRRRRRDDVDARAFPP